MTHCSGKTIIAKSRSCFIIFAFLFGAIGATAHAAAEGVEARYVIIDIPVARATLSLAEVQVYSGDTNIAVKGTARQTSTAHGGSAQRALDNNTSGDWNDHSITHTANDLANPAWELDLGAEKTIGKIVVWNRDGFESRLHGGRIALLDGKRVAVWEADLGKPGRGATTVTVHPGVKGGRIGKKIDFTAAATRPTSPTSLTASSVDPAALKRAIDDLTLTFGDRYPKGREYLQRLAALDPEKDREALDALQREALLANPLLDFDTLLVVQRGAVKGLGLPANWQGNSSLPRSGYSDQIMTLSLRDGRLKTLYRPERPVFVGDVDLHYDADRLLFSSIRPDGAWGVFEVEIDGSGLRRVSPDTDRDIDNFDPLYLPDGRIIFASTSTYSGVPCVGGRDLVANLHIMNADGTGVRRLCFDQDGNWYPVMLNSGRVLYLRWEYTDSAHYYSRVLMSMNPDGTDQKAYYGSNSYWPNSLFYARPIPGSYTKFVGIVSGHHGVRRAGGLVLFDVSLGRHETDGAVQLIPGFGKPVENITADNLAARYKPRFLHPYPLSDKYFLAAIDLGEWCICLVDVFDNIVILKEPEKGFHLFEPLPLRVTASPPVLPDRVRPGEKQATVWMSNVYKGPGLQGVPPGTVKKLRVFQYEYAPRRRGGHYAMGMEAGWDQHVILGTVPIEEDGSAIFEIPANTPVSIQPLDGEGKALQLMRSWTVGMPGERLSCIGCHESQNQSPPSKPTLASARKPRKLEDWYGPRRGIGFVREVQPVLEKYCVGCHDGNSGRTHGMHERIAGEKTPPDFTTPTSAYRVIHPYVRRNGPEGDYHLLTPLEFHADTSELIQMLQKGHYNVQLDTEAWDRLITWIDLNAPYHATWKEAGADPETLARRFELRKQYAAVDYDTEIIVESEEKNTFIPPPVMKRDIRNPQIEGWPFDRPAAQDMQGDAARMEVAIGDGIKMNFVRIPAGVFPMGSNNETPVEQPVSAVEVADPFWMGTTEVTLAQYRLFDPDYMNGVYDMHYKDQVKRGYFMNEPEFPAIRVSWLQAIAYCRWLSAATGRDVQLPTEAQWEWACRAGTATPLSFGDCNTDFGAYANLADVTVKEMAVRGVNPKPIKNPPPHLDFELKDARFNDGVLHLANVGSYKPNAWGLHDMHGNAAEWTRSAYAPYPYDDSDGRNDTSVNLERAVRGGSWHDRQHRSTSSFRLGFPQWQRVYHVGFRVIISD